MNFPYFSTHLISIAPLDQEIFREFSFLEGKNLSRSSLVARYYLLLYLRETLGYRGQVETDEQGRPRVITNYEGRITNKGKEEEILLPLYWSLSHSHDRVAFIVSDHPVGIDIELVRPRDPSLFSIHSEEEYEIIMNDELRMTNTVGIKKNLTSQDSLHWHSFYLLWTAKESILKILPEMTLDSMSEIRLVEVLDSSGLLFVFHEENYSVESMMIGEYRMSWIV